MKDITCECGRGPRETCGHQDDAGVWSWSLAERCTECLEPRAPAQPMGVDMRDPLERERVAGILRGCEKVGVKAWQAQVLALLRDLLARPHAKEDCVQCRKVRGRLELLGVPLSRALSPYHALDVFLARLAKEDTLPAQQPTTGEVCRYDSGDQCEPPMCLRHGEYKPCSHDARPSATTGEAEEAAKFMDLRAQEAEQLATNTEDTDRASRMQALEDARRYRLAARALRQPVVVTEGMVERAALTHGEQIARMVCSGREIDHLAAMRAALTAALNTEGKGEKS